MARYRQEYINPYDARRKKGEQVAEMFDNIAPTYDKLNHRLSFNIDKYWRRKALRQLKTYDPMHVLDVATGTGDFALLAVETFTAVDVTAIDLSEKMLAIARQKARDKGFGCDISFEKEDCMALSYQDKYFDGVISAFGIRNFASLEHGLKEMYRVLIDGGRLCIVELTEPVYFPMKQLFRLYSHTVLPAYGKMISKDPAAYTYLTKTIEAFPQGEEMMKLLKRIGFRHAFFERMTFGICTMYIAMK